MLFEYHKIHPLHVLGVVQYTHDILAPNYGKDPITVPCTVYANIVTPGLYKMTDFQLPLIAALFGAPESVLVDYEDVYWRKSPLLIDAQDPENVFIEAQDYGVCANSNDGFIDAVTSLKPGKTEPFSVGYLRNGEITFPTPNGMLCTFNGDGWYYADINGAFKLVLPSTNASGTSYKPAVKGKSSANFNFTYPSRVATLYSRENVFSKTLKSAAVSVAKGKASARSKNSKPVFAAQR